MPSKLGHPKRDDVEVLRRAVSSALYPLLCFAADAFLGHRDASAASRGKKQTRSVQNYVKGSHNGSVHVTEEVILSKVITTSTASDYAEDALWRRVTRTMKSNIP